MFNAKPIAQRFNSLTPRQREVCLLIAQGLLSKQIAHQLGTSINTVKTHRTEIFRKMGASSLLDLVRMVDEINGLRASRFDTTKSPAHAEPAPASRALKLLVVDDHHTVREALVQGMRDRGHEAIGAANGDDIESLLGQHRVDILLLDVGLGEGHCDGFTVARIARRVSNCGIVMITARGEREARIQGLGDGADAYLVKPVDFDELHAVILSVARRVNGRGARP